MYNLEQQEEEEEEEGAEGGMRPWIVRCGRQAVAY